MNLQTTLLTSSLLATSAQAVDWNKYSSSILIEVTRERAIFTSSAVVIKRNVLLTAAHSVENINEGYVHLENNYNAENKKIKFKKVIIHQDYDVSKSNFKNDIALIILESNLPEHIKPISLSKGISVARATVDRIGFGQRLGKNSRTWTNPQIVDYQDNTLILKDSLSVIGDSGGPIYLNNELLGIHSTLEGTEKTYAVYVPNYLNWINDHLPMKDMRL